MVKRTVIVGVTAILLLVSAGACQSGRDPQNFQEAYRRFVTVWHDFAYDSTKQVWEYSDYCWREFVAFGKLDVYKDSLIAIALVDLDTADPALSARYLALEMLGRFRTPLTDSALTRLIENEDDLAVDAARIMIRRGYWDLAAPVLVKNRFFGDLGDDPRALPILMDAFNGSTDAFRRFDLARMLTYRFDQSGLLLPAARQVLTDPLLPDSSFSGKLDALTELESSLDPADVSLVANIVMTTSDRNLRVDAWATLVTMARNGSEDALDQLRRIGRDSSDMYVREITERTLQQITPGK